MLYQWWPMTKIPAAITVTDRDRQNPGNKIEPASNQAKDLLDFLRTHKKLPEYIAIHDEEAGEDTFRFFV
jgi:hypothetical protein